MLSILTIGANICSCPRTTLPTLPPQLFPFRLTFERCDLMLGSCDCLLSFVVILIMAVLKVLHEVTAKERKNPQWNGHSWPKLATACVQAKCLYWFITQEVPTAIFAETNANLSTQFEDFCNPEFNDLLWSQGFHVSKWPASNERQGEHSNAFRQPLRDCFTLEELHTRPSNQQISNLDRILINTEKNELKSIHRSIYNRK